MTYVLFDVDTCDELTLMDQLTNSTSRLAMGRPKKRMYAFSNRASNRAASLASKQRTGMTTGISQLCPLYRMYAVRSTIGQTHVMPSRANSMSSLVSLSTG